MNRQGNRFITLALLSFLLAPTSNAEEKGENNTAAETTLADDTIRVKDLSNQPPKVEKKEVEPTLATLSNLADRIKLHGYAQAGYTYQRNSEFHSNTFDIKRTLLWANAQITDRWAFLFMHDFNSQVQEFYTDYRVTKNKALFVRFGQFKNAYSLENPLSPTIMETIDVYSEGVTYLSGCGSDPLYGVQYGRDLGLSLFGDFAQDRLHYELQVMNGQGINRKDKNNSKDVIGRLEFRPTKGLNIVASWQLGRGHAVEKSIYNPEINIDQNYDRDRYSFGADYRSQRFNIHGEFLEGKDKDVKSQGGYVTGSVALLPGKFDLIGSYDYFNFNKDRDMDQHKGVFGFQWWYYPKCRLQLQYVYKTAYTTATEFVKEDNHAIMCQVQVRFN